MTSAVPFLHLDGDDFPDAERFDRWRAAVPPYDVARLDPSSGPFRVKTSAWFLGDLVVTSGHLGAVRMVRSAERIRADGRDNFSFLLLRRGFWTGDVDGRMLTAGPGELVMFDLTRAMVAEGAESDHLTVSIARKSVEAMFAEMPDLHGLMLDQAAGRMLADHFLSLVRHLPAMQVSDVPAVTRATIGVIAGALTVLTKGRVAVEPANGAAIRHRVRRFIDQNLTTSDLTPERICRELALSRSALYRAFSIMGGVTYYIQGRRLEAVHALLSRPDEQRRVAEIAYAHGFLSDAHFSTAFRRRYGYTPSEARRGATTLRSEGGPAEPDDVPALYLEWIRKLNA
jgi:AraC-like DNA-binding protein